MHRISVNNALMERFADSAGTSGTSGLTVSMNRFQV
jgi:hypothetical protein